MARISAVRIVKRANAFVTKVTIGNVAFEGAQKAIVEAIVGGEILRSEPPDEFDGPPICEDGKGPFTVCNFLSNSERIASAMLEASRLLGGIDDEAEAGGLGSERESVAEAVGSLDLDMLMIKVADLNRVNLQQKGQIARRSHIELRYDRLNLRANRRLLLSPRLDFTGVGIAVPEIANPRNRSRNLMVLLGGARQGHLFAREKILAHDVEMGMTARRS